MTPPPLQEIPIFPLNVVLFPGMRLPLRIFEPRYKKLYEDHLQGGGRFGIALIREGSEVGQAATPHDVGTLAEVEAVDSRNDNLFLLCRGAQRFRIHRLNHDRPYLVGLVELLEDPVARAADEPGARRLVERFSVYLDRMQRVAAGLWGGQLQAPAPRPDRSLAEAVRAVAFTLPMQPSEKQELLEESDFGRFVETLSRRLEAELEFLEPEPEPYADPRRT